jgi:hypothetical protein
MLVVSETGKGVPVAYCLSNVEKAEHWSLLIDKSFGRTNRDPSKSTYMSDDCPRIKKKMRPRSQSTPIIVLVPYDASH